VVVVQKARPVSSAVQASVNAIKVRRGDVRRAVIVRTRKPVRRPDGSFIRFDDNAAVLLNNKREMLGTRIGGMVSSDLRMKGWGKIVSLAPRVSSSACSPLHYSCMVACRLYRFLRIPNYSLLSLPAGIQMRRFLRSRPGWLWIRHQYFGPDSLLDTRYALKVDPHGISFNYVLTHTVSIVNSWISTHLGA